MKNCGIPFGDDSHFAASVKLSPAAGEGLLHFGGKFTDFSQTWANRHFSMDGKCDRMYKKNYALYETRPQPCHCEEAEPTRQSQGSRVHPQFPVHCCQEIATAPSGPRNDSGFRECGTTSQPCHCEERSDAAISGKSRSPAISRPLLPRDCHGPFGASQ